MKKLFVLSLSLFVVIVVNCQTVRGYIAEYRKYYACESEVFPCGGDDFELSVVDSVYRNGRRRIIFNLSCKKYDYKINPCYKTNKVRGRDRVVKEFMIDSLLTPIRNHNDSEYEFLRYSSLNGYFNEVFIMIDDKTLGLIQSDYDHPSEHVYIIKTYLKNK